MMPRPMENGDRVLTKLETENCLSSAEVLQKPGQTYSAINKWEKYRCQMC